MTELDLLASSRARSRHPGLPYTSRTVRLVDAAGLAREAAGPGTCPRACAAPPTCLHPDGLVRLSAPADASDYGRVLYAALREADALALTMVLAVPPAPGAWATP